MYSNFKFLKTKYPELSKTGELAEKYLFNDPNTSIFKVGQFAEYIVSCILVLEQLEFPYKENTHSNRIRFLKQNDLLPPEIEGILQRLRKQRNKAVHQHFDSFAEAKILLEHAHSLATWFMQVYIDYSYEPLKYSAPIQSLQSVDKLQEENEKLQSEINKLNTENIKLSEKLSKEKSEDRRKRSFELSNKMSLSEAETRDLIDEQLREAGWEANTQVLKYSSGVRPEKGRNLAISEWPTDSILPKKNGRGYADYALFCGLKLIGIIEAKKKDEDIISVIDDQCKDYSQKIKEEHSQYVIGDFGGHKVPFLFAANSRNYLKEIEEKSGIWFLDTRRSSNLKKPLKSWMSPLNIEQLLESNIDDANDLLQEDSSDYLTDENGLDLRYYQLDAIDAVSNAVIDGKRSMLLSMATGTGKTRVALGLVYKLLKNKRFNRILFLVDRNALGTQAQEKFEEVKIEDLKNICQIYDVKTLIDKEIEKDTRIHIATVQSLVSRILYSDSYTSLGAGDYDLIIVDEAHRGYILDKEMDDDDIEFRNQLDYRSKYRQVIDYFDAVKIGLTATPALHTTEIFGKPIFNYSYRQAVIDGYLVDHEPPHIIRTDLNTNGIRYEKGESLAIYDPDTNEITNSDELEDEIKFDVDTFNSRVITPSFNKTALEKIAEFINPEGEEKTLIFAVDDNHADTIVKILEEIFEKYEINNDAIRKITGKTEGGKREKIDVVIKQYKNEKFPNIAVTVDLLTTGIDIPEITNIVFLRPVKSRILFEQMIGRATRLCPAINKTHFNIIDAVYVYETLEPFTNMKPVVQSAKEDMEGLIEDIDKVSASKQKVFIDKIIAKLHRKKNLAVEKEIEQIKYRHGGKDINDIINDIRFSTTEEAIKKVREYKETLLFIDSFYNRKSRAKIYSDKEDQLTDVTRGYGEAKKPEDYLESFKKYIEENKDKIPALSLVCTRPSILTRKELKGLMLELDSHMYNETTLRTAWKEAKNEDIAADIISFIRNVALDIPIQDHEYRIRAAIKKIKDQHGFNKVQEMWIDRIESTLINDYIIDLEVFDVGAYKSDGGFKRINKIFDGKLEKLVYEINEALYQA